METIYDQDTDTHQQRTQRYVRERAHAPVVQDTPPPEDTDDGAGITLMETWSYVGASFL